MKSNARRLWSALQGMDVQNAVAKVHTTIAVARRRIDASDQAAADVQDFTVMVIDLGLLGVQGGGAPIKALSP